MKKKLSLILLSGFLVACVSNDTVENKKLIQISSYLDLTMKHGKKLPLMRQRMLFNKYWKMKSFKMNPSINRPRKAQSGCVQLLVCSLFLLFYYERVMKLTCSYLIRAYNVIYRKSKSN